MHFPGRALPSFAGDVLAVMFVTISTLLLNTTGIEIATRTEANIERDLKVHGLANLLTGGLGGMVVCTSLSRSILVRTAGATSRLSGLTVAAISAAVLIADPSFLGYVPKYVLGGLLLYLGSDLVYQWLIHSSRRLLPLEYLSLIAIAALIIYSGFIAGVLIGIVIGCATFALSASRVNAIKFNFDGSNYRSTLDRGPSELALLAEHGRQIQGMTLQSYLFFGSANRLYQYVKTLLARQPDCRFLIFDFRLVTGIDSSATHSFAQIKQVTAAHGVRIVLAHLSPELERAFRTARFISDDVTIVADLDRALESCEQKVIETHRAEAVEKPSLRAWLSEALGSAEHADRLAALLPPARSRSGRHHCAPRRAGRLDAFHSRRPRRHHRRHGRRPDHARAQPRPPHHHRRNGLDHPAAAQRHHPGRDRKRALRARRRRLRDDQARAAGAQPGVARPMWSR